jgi:hypothetical protein
MFRQVVHHGEVLLGRMPSSGGKHLEVILCFVSSGFQ